MRQKRKYTVSDAVIAQRRAASEAAAKKHPVRVKWVASAIRKPNKERAILDYGSVNEALAELFRRDDAKRAKASARKEVK